MKVYRSLPDIYQLMRLQAQPPLRMPHHAVQSLADIVAGTRLQEEIPGRKRLVHGNVLPLVHHLHLIHTRDTQLRPLLGRAGYPVHIIRQRTRSVSFDTDKLPHAVQAVYELPVNPERRLSTRQYHRCCGIFPHFRQNLLIGHPDTLLVLRIAERALQVTAGKTDKDGGSTRMEPLSLQAVKYLVNLSHKLPHSIRTPVPPP